MVRALPHGSDTRIDFGRIAAIAAAIAVHAAALLMLLMPMAAPPVTITVKPKPVVRWIDKAPPPEVVEIVEKREITQPVEPRTVTVPQPTTQAPVFENPVIVEGGSEPAVETAAVDSGEVAGPAIGNGPLPSATLEYVRATSPRYPTNELRNNIQGTVILRVLVDIDGKPVDVTIETSSGNRNLDKEARQHVLKTWRFKPAMQNGQAVQAYGLVPIAFNLQ
jgi:protein TonB